MDAERIRLSLDTLASDNLAQLARLNELLARPRTLESGAEYERIRAGFVGMEGRLQVIEGRVREHRNGGRR